MFSHGNLDLNRNGAERRLFANDDTLDRIIRYLENNGEFRLIFSIFFVVTTTKNTSKIDCWIEQIMMRAAGYLLGTPSWESSVRWTIDPGVSTRECQDVR